MKTITTSDHTAYYATADERSLPSVTLGGILELRACWRKTQAGNVRSWYIQGDFGSLHWPTLDGDECLRACEETLAAAGWTNQGELPPDCFEYRKAPDLATA